MNSSPPAIDPPALRVLLLTDYYPPDKIGGVGELVSQLACMYRELGHSVTVLTTGSTDVDESVLRSSKRLTLGVLQNNVHALRFVLKEQFDVVHMHQAGSTLFLLARPFFRRFPRVITSLQVSYGREAEEIRSWRAGERTFRPTLQEWVERVFFAPAHIVLDLLGVVLSDVVTVVSRQNQAELQRSTRWVRGRKPVWVVPNGLSRRLESSPRSQFRDQALEDRLLGRPTILYTGVFRTRKRVQLLLMAMREVVRECPDAFLVLVGGGRGYDRRMRDLAGDLGIHQHVMHVGPVTPDRVRYYLELSDIFCLPSVYEGMPMALLEAMGAGKAVVTTDAYGMRDLVENGRTGILVQPDDLTSLVRALLELVRHPERRRALGAAAGDHINRHYNWSRIAQDYLSLIAS